METNIEKDEHIFGVPEYLNADLYEEKEVVRAKVLDYLGRRGYTTPLGDVKRAAYLKVKGPEGTAQEFRLGISNEITLAKKHKVKGYDELKGHTLLLLVKHYKFGNGFVLVGFE